ncbi:pyruvate-flavodoxin oxidoreductase [bacterium BMS3Abin02]|nr:pyruvate-flavodoxin oxidoreductase [bacterium BMS3Abin02]
MEHEVATLDGNEAAAYIAHRTNEVIAIYPITPSSPMGEHADAWSAKGMTNIWNQIPEVVEMQSEGGASGAVHGSLQGGALTTTFTASQGLLLMIPNMFKIAGELLPTVFHVAARSVATHALSIFGDHSDVMATRGTGFGMMASASIQEVHDFALISQAATLASRVPIVHFFDGFRTSHEINKIEIISDDIIREMIDDDLVRAHHERRLNPEHPVLRGSAQNPDVFFQAREAANPFYIDAPDHMQRAMDRFAELTGRSYHLFDYFGEPDAERVIVLMGSGVGAVRETVDKLAAAGEKVGVVAVRVYRPFSAAAFVAALPGTTKTLAVLDRTKEPGAVGEPLYVDVVTGLAEEHVAGRTAWEAMPTIIGGRYGLSSKEFSPAMIAGIFEEMAKSEPKNHFTVGIVDDVTGTSLSIVEGFDTEPEGRIKAVFFGLGADGTVGASKNSVKIIGTNTPLNAQGYFVYDSRKAGSVTVSHLRFCKEPIQSTYLIDKANFVGCHQFVFLEKMGVLDLAADGGTFLLNSPYGPDEVWDEIPEEVQRQIIDKHLEFYVVDGYHVAREAGMPGRINTVLQTCFFALSGILPREQAINEIKTAIAKTYGKFGESVLEKNYAAVDGALDSLHEVPVPAETTSELHMRPPVPKEAPDFVQRVTSLMLQGKGDLLPVSAMPVDGTFPTATTRWEKRNIAEEIPIWDPDICIDCAKCVLVCPHAAIRMKVYDPAFLDDAPITFKSKEWRSRDLPDMSMTIQVAPEDCTGCGVCVDVCPAKSKEIVRHKSINMRPHLEHVEEERTSFEFFLEIPEMDRTKVKIDTVKGSQMLQPLFEFSGACAGCGETPYIKLLTQLFGDRTVIANATGCSSIYGGNLPTTPYAQNGDGRGPAWANSLFEDNAEYGFGMRLAFDAEVSQARSLVKKMTKEIGLELAHGLLEADQSDETGIAAQRARVAQLKERLTAMDSNDAKTLRVVADALVTQSVWIVGGDGWAYDIGFGGLDHVLASGRNVNVLVLDTEVYSNTGGQASKATPLGAVAKFAASGKSIGKKDLGMIAMQYGNIYVAQIAIAANNIQSVKAFTEAEAFNGPSLIIAYSQCIAHGIDMGTGMSHQTEAVKSGFWPLFRFDPRKEDHRPFKLDSRKPTLPFEVFADKEARFAMLKRTNPDRAKMLFGMAQEQIDERWSYYEQLSGIERKLPEEEADV